LPRRKREKADMVFADCGSRFGGIINRTIILAVAVTK
jgi:hypothetical protein